MTFVPAFRLRSLSTLALGALISLSVAAAHAAVPGPTTTVKNGDNRTMLADLKGRTLYVYDPDQGQATSVCNGGCAFAWPPSVLPPAVVATLPAPFGAVIRSNGDTQLTFRGRPLYTYRLDSKLGDDRGNGLGGVWHTILLK